MAQTHAGIVIDPNTLTSIRALIDALNTQLEVDFVPEFLKTLDETLPLTSATFEFNAAKQKYEFAIGFGVKIGEDSEGEARHLEISLNILVAPDKLTGGKRLADYGGSVKIPIAESGLTHLQFDGQFSSKAGDMWILQCSFSEEQSLPLGALFGATAPALAALLPEELTIPLQQNLTLVITGRMRTGSGPLKGIRLLLGLGFHTNVDLGQFPLVGLQFNSEQTRAFITLELLVATHEFTHKELKALNGVLMELGSPLRIQPPSATQQSLEYGVYAGLTAVFGKLKYAWYTQLKTPRRGSHPFSRSERRRVPRSTSDDVPITLGDNAAWLSVERSVGPIHLEKLGLEYRDGAVSFIPEMIVSVGDLRLVLEGISVRLPLSSGKPEFRVDGFGLEYTNDVLQVGGAFLRSRRDGHDEYAGMASLQLKLKGNGLGLAAIGAYADRPDTGTSLFLYASLSYPLGGPPFFFVTGLSGGFGYNRDLRVPPLEDVADFPLVAQAWQGTGGWNSENASAIVASQLSQLSSYIPLQPDTGFLALGVKFTSFKMLDGFALLTVVLGKRFELGLLGLARLQVPFSGTKKAVAVVELALQARFAPSEGVAMVRGELTSASYLLSPDCRLTGGFAFATWFSGEHAGDFVLTMGGYHPNFRVPPHYPVVPRVGFDWRVGSTLTLRGQSYFALCAHAVMAGGSFEASFRSGSAWASFRMGADFLICWKPYCYDISLYLHFKFGLGCLKASLGAQLRIWGPEFGGYAKLKVFLFSVKVKFGNQDSFAPRPIDWSEFQSSFLPASHEVCSIAVAEGLTRQIQPSSGEALWIVNPKEFALTTDTVVPLSEAWHPESSTAVGGKALGVVPMGVKAGALESTLRVTLKRNGGPVEQGKFKYTPITRQMPAGLWGNPKVHGSGSTERLSFPDVNGTSFVDDALVGLRIEPGEPPNAENTDDLPVAALRFDPELHSDAYAFQTLSAFRAMPGDDDTRRAAIQRTIGEHTARHELLAALGFDPVQDVVLRADVVDTFVFAPQVKAA